MNLKRLFSVFFLITLLISSISIPQTSSAQEACKVVSAQFSSKPQGPNWYKSGKTEQLLLAINNVDACKDKKIKLRIIALTGSAGEESIEATKTPIEAVFNQGSKSMNLPLSIKEEKCYDLDQNSIETETVEVGDNITEILAKRGMSNDEFLEKAFNILKADSDMDALKLAGGADWYDKNTLTKETTQAVLDTIDDVGVPDSQTTFGDNLAYALGLVGGIANGINKQEIFEDYVAKTIFFRAGIYDCSYKIQIDDPATEQEDFTDAPSPKLSYMCEIGTTSSGNDCTDGNWESKSGFTPGIRPTVVTESLCLNKDGTGYDEECYEPLAPIPGFGRKINFADTNSEDGTQPFTLGTYVGTLIKIAVGAASVLAVIFLTVAGIQYMIAGKTGGGATLDKAKKKLFNVGWGLLVILGSWILLNTINPELLKINPKFEKVVLEVPVMNRNAIPGFNEAINKINFDGTPIDMSQISDPVLVTYMYHQQGEGGAPAIMWAAKSGMSSVPTTNPFTTSSRINSNMANNYPDHCKKTFGAITPAKFITCWVKIIAAKPADFGTIAPANLAEIQKVSSATGLDLNLMKVMCLIESGCVDPNKDNGQGFVGLFQLSKDVYAKFGTGGGDNRRDAYANTVAAAGYAKYNLGRYEKHKSKIESANGGNNGNTQTQTTGAKSILAVGDSITFRPTSYVDQFVKKHSEFSVDKKAKVGASSSWALAEINGKKGSHYEVVTILIGTNDFYSGLSLQKSKSNVDEIIKAAKTIAPIVIVVGPPSDRFYSKTTPDIQSKLAQLRAYMSSYSGITYLDFFALTNSSASNFDDGLHPDDDAHKALMNKLDGVI